MWVLIVMPIVMQFAMRFSVVLTVVLTKRVSPWDGEVPTASRWFRQIEKFNGLNFHLGMSHLVTRFGWHRHTRRFKLISVCVLFKAIPAIFRTICFRIVARMRRSDTSGSRQTARAASFERFESWIFVELVGRLSSGKTLREEPSRRSLQKNLLANKVRQKATWSFEVARI